MKRIAARVLRKHLLSLVPLVTWSTLAALTVNIPLHLGAPTRRYLSLFFRSRSPVLVWFEIQVWMGFLCLCLLIFGSTKLPRKFVCAFSFPLLVALAVHFKLQMLGAVPIWTDFKALLQHASLILKSLPQTIFNSAVLCALLAGALVLLIRYAKKEVVKRSSEERRKWLHPRKSALMLNVGLASMIVATLLSNHPTVSRLLSRLPPFSDVEFDLRTHPKGYGYSLFFIRQARHSLGSATRFVLRRNELEQELLNSISKRTIATTSTPRTTLVLVLESFIDPKQFRFTYSRDPIPNLRKFAASGVSGSALVPVTTGLTAQTEFELLTALPITELSLGQVPFLDGISRPMNTMVRSFSDSGYQTVALHNGKGGSYRRKFVYPKLGFKKTRLLEQMDDGRRISKWPDDAMLIEAVLEELRDPTPKFIHALSISSHGPWDEPTSGSNPIQVTYPDKTEPERARGFTNYVNQLNLVDTRLKPLLDFVVASKNIDIVILGDHWPFVAQHFKRDFIASPSMERALATAGEPSSSVLVPFLVPLYLYPPSNLAKELGERTVPAWCLLPLITESAIINLSRSQIYLRQACRDGHQHHPLYSSLPTKVRDIVAAIVHHTVYSAFEMEPTRP